MKVAERLKSRQANWRELEQLCSKLENRRLLRAPAASVAHFASLYRSACADLALADAYQLPPGTVHYLHQLVGRAHNQLYRSQRFDLRGWGHEMFSAVPGRLYRDGALRLAMAIFWGFFLLSAYLSSARSPFPHYVNAVLGEEMILQMEQMYADPIGSGDRPGGAEGFMTGFYINNNTAIGLRCFSAGLLFGVGGLFATTFNAYYLGAVFGHMSTVPQWENFFVFVTAHGPFELTAIVLSAAAGMRLGFALVDTKGLSRQASVRRAGREAMPTMVAAMVMFVLAALIEGFISPSSLPYEVKAAVAVASTAIILFYIVGLGYRSAMEDE